MRICWAVLFLLLVCPLPAQTDSIPTPTDTARYDGNLVIAPLIYYQPETSWAFGVGALYTISDKLHPANNPSLLKLLGVYTLEKQIQSELGGDIYWKENSYYLSFNLTYYKFPGLFFGIGNDSKSEDAESYTISRPYARVNLVREIGYNISVGFKTFYEYTRLLETEPGGILDTEDIPGEEGGHNVGIGPWLVFDHRDNIFYPTGGWKTDLSSVWHVPFIGSDYTYVQTRVEVSTFKAIYKQQVLAWNILADLNSGTPPFNRMALLGGQSYMRGNFEGRIRDKHLLATQLEYRIPVWRFIGVTGFGGLGEVAAQLADFSLSGLKYSYGAGLRLELMPGSDLRLRIDYGIGSDGDRGLYVQFNEAF